MTAVSGVRNLLKWHRMRNWILRPDVAETPRIKATGLGHWCHFHDLEKGQKRSMHHPSLRHQVASDMLCLTYGMSMPEVISILLLAGFSRVLGRAAPGRPRWGWLSAKLGCWERLQSFRCLFQLDLWDWLMWVPWLSHSQVAAVA